MILAPLWLQQLIVKEKILEILFKKINQLLDLRLAKKYILRNLKLNFKEKIVLHLLNIIQINHFLINKNLKIKQCRRN